MKKIPLLLMGCGGVGRQLLDHIISCRPLHSKLGLRLRVVGVCDSSSLVVASDVFSEELDDAFLKEVCRIKSNGSSLVSLSNFGACQVVSNQEVVKKATDIATLLGKSTGMAFVDCSASSETIGMLTQVVGLGCSVVLANKKPLTASLELYDKLVSQPRRIRHESTVGAGLPVIAALNRMVSCGDPIYRIIGSLSGTLGYVMSELENGKPFSQVVNAAKSLGYTEPDPRDDLSGMDVARKPHFRLHFFPHHFCRFKPHHRRLLPPAAPPPKNFLFTLKDDNSPLKVIDIGLSDFVRPGQDEDNKRNFTPYPMIVPGLETINLIPQEIWVAILV